MIVVGSIALVAVFLNTLPYRGEIIVFGILLINLGLVLGLPLLIAPPHSTLFTTGLWCGCGGVVFLISILLILGVDQGGLLLDVTVPVLLILGFNLMAISKLIESRPKQ
jgi:hypothetical protein